MNIATASAFLQAQDSEIVQARLTALQTRRAGTLPVALLAAQNSDGGWPYAGVTGRPSSLHETVTVLEWLADVGQIETLAATRSLAFLVQQQSKRGIWREATTLVPFGLQPWMDPESTAADIYTTALCASAVAQWSEHDLAVDRAVYWLQSQQGRDGLLAGFRLHSSWLALPAFVQALDATARATRRIVGGLGEALDPAWTGSMLARCLRTFLAANYTTHTPIVARLWTQLQEAQLPSGAVTVEEGEDQIEATLHAVAVALQLTKGMPNADHRND